jgi:hypothetical protein
MYLRLSPVKISLDGGGPMWTLTFFIPPARKKVNACDFQCKKLLLEENLFPHFLISIWQIYERIASFEQSGQ